MVRDVAQTREGALKIAAQRIGTSLRAYKGRVSRGEKWCTLCKKWHRRSMFAKDSTRYDGLVSSCRKSKSADYKRRYVPSDRPPPTPGRSFVPARDGDKLQARRRVNFFVESGLIPHPNDVPCEHCGHTYDGKRRHEYHHHLGYDAEHHEDVIVVCTLCHREAHKE